VKSDAGHRSNFATMFKIRKSPKQVNRLERKMDAPMNFLSEIGSPPLARTVQSGACAASRILDGAVHRLHIRSYHTHHTARSKPFLLGNTCSTHAPDLGWYA